MVKEKVYGETPTREEINIAEQIDTNEEKKDLFHWAVWLELVAVSEAADKRPFSLFVHLALRGIALWTTRSLPIMFLTVRS